MKGGGLPPFYSWQLAQHLPSRQGRSMCGYPYWAGLTPNPSPNGEGSNMWGYPYWPACVRRRRFFSHEGHFFSLTDHTDLTELFHQRFEPTEGLRHTEFTEASPPAPLRLERGVVCVVTPIGLLRNGEETLNAWMTYRGISVITPLSIRRGAGGEASVAVRFCVIGWLNVSVCICVFCSSVFFCERKNVLRER